MESQLESYTNTEISGGGSSDAESHVLELKLKALILDTIHSIDVVQQLIKHGIKSLDEWMWQKQLRYYMQKRNLLYLYSRCRNSTTELVMEIYSRTLISRTLIFPILPIAKTKRCSPLLSRTL